MDEQQLQQKEIDLKIKENELNIRESDLNNRDTRASLQLDLTINKQEFLRRAIEVGAQALQKLDAMSAEVGDKVVKNLEELIDVAVLKLTEELKK